MNNKKQQDKLRHEILNIEYDSKHYDVKYVKDISLEQLLRLIDENLIDVEEAQNNSPTVEEFINFLKDYPKFKAHGYIVTPDREDFRISIEGLKVEEDLTTEEILAFSNKFHNADEFQVTTNYARCWWD